ncbi:MAG: hypothetical protein IKQ55_00965 [Kiritimatiellae bacterium]|nr:hypothetical protein [Kiritimatiellia bacterium]
MNILKSATRETASFLREIEEGPALGPSYAFPVTAALVLAVGTAAFTAYLATATGRAILGELRRRQRLREKRPDAPSLRGAPTPEELEADGAIAPRTLAIRLRLGSRLADLEPTLDSGISCKTLKNGQKRIKARAPGLKGWLSDRRVSINYSTLVRYKKLAQRLRQLLALDDRLPLEWLLPGTAPDIPLPADLRSQYVSAHRRLAKLLREHGNYTRLSRHVAAKLGIPPLLAARRTARRAAQGGGRRRRGGARRTPPAPSPERVDATKRELLRFLREPARTAPLARLRDQALQWLRTAGGPAK